MYPTQMPAPQQTPQVIVQKSTTTVTSALLSAGLMVGVFYLGKTVGTLKERLRQQYANTPEVK